MSPSSGISRRLLIPAALAALMAVTGPAWSQDEDEPDPRIIIVVDFQGALRSTSAAQSIQQQVDDARDVYQQRFGAMETALREEEARLTQERDEMSEEQFLDRRRELEQQVLDAQRAVQEGRSTLDRALATGMAQVRAVLLEEVAAIAEAENASIVLDKAHVILVSQALDRTNDVIERVNDRLPTVTLDALNDIMEAQP